jgi:hypothetical protein
LEEYLCRGRASLPILCLIVYIKFCRRSGILLRIPAKGPIVTLSFKLIVLSLLALLAITTLNASPNFLRTSRIAPTHVSAQGASQNKVKNLTGTWQTDDGDTIKIAQQGNGSFSSSFLNDTSCTGPAHPTNRTFFIMGTIQNGTSMTGKMQNCTMGGDNSTLVKYCGLPDLWVTTFNATAGTNNITGQYLGQYWSWNTTDANGNPTHCFLEYNYSANFTITKIIPPPPCLNGTVPYLSQANPNWGSKPLGTSEAPPVTIQQKGCALLSSAMMLSYVSGKIVNPQDLNNWLGNNSGYEEVNRFNPISGFLQPAYYILNWEKIAEYARTVLNVPLYFNQTVSKRNDTLLDQSLSLNVPVIMGQPGHFVVATCKNVTASGLNFTYTINDPGYSNRINLNNSAYKNKYQSLRLYSIVKPKSLGSMTGTAHSPVELTITDSQGRITGPNSTQIPHSAYSLDYLVDDSSANAQLDPGIPTVDLVMPDNGTYRLDVLGTGFGNYTIDFVFFDNAGNSYTEQLKGTAAPSSLDEYQINFTDATGSHVQIVKTSSTTSLTTNNSSSNSSISSSTQSGVSSPTILAAVIVATIAVVAVVATIALRKRKSLATTPGAGEKS